MALLFFFWASHVAQKLLAKAANAALAAEVGVVGLLAGGGLACADDAAAAAGFGVGMASRGLAPVIMPTTGGANRGRDCTFGLSPSLPRCQDVHVEQLLQQGVGHEQRRVEGEQHRQLDPRRALLEGRRVVPHLHQQLLVLAAAQRE